MRTPETVTPLRAALAALKAHPDRVTQKQVGAWVNVTQQTVGFWLQAGGLVPAHVALTIEHELVRRGIRGITRRELCPGFPWHLAEAPAEAVGAGTVLQCASSPAASSCTEGVASCNAS